MKDGEEKCELCELVLDAHCQVFQHHGPPGQEDAFCRLREQYHTEQGVGINEVYDRLIAVATSDQIDEVTRFVDQQRGASAAPTAPEAQAEPEPTVPGGGEEGQTPAVPE